MAADLRWVASLVDQVSAPAKKMVKSLEGFQGGMQRADKALASMAGGKVAKVGDAIMGKLRGGFHAATGAAVAFAGSAAGAFISVSKAAAAFALDDVIQGENLDLALKTLIGDAKKFDDATKQISGLANFWGGSDPDDLEKQMIKLVSKGHDVADALKIMQGAADLGVLGNDVNGLIDAFSQLDDKGQLSAKSLAALGKSGLDPKKLREALGTSIGSSGDLQEDIEHAIKAGTLDVATLQTAALTTITKMTGKALGGLAEEQGHTIGGLLDNLEKVPARMMDALDMSGSVEPMRKALEALTTALNPSGPTGQKVAAALSKISGSVGRIITAVVGDGSKIGEWVDAIASGIEILADVIDAVSEIVSGFVDEFMVGLEAILGPMGKFGGAGMSMDRIVKALVSTFKFLGAVVGVTLGLVIQIASWIVQGVLWVVGAWNSLEQALSKKAIEGYFLDLYGIVAGTFDELLDYLDELWESFKGLGGSIVDGIWAGIKGGWDTLKKGWNALVGTLPESVATKLQIQSPSRVMERLGGFAAEGFTLGVANETGNAKTAFAGLSLAGLSAGGGGGTVAARASIGQVVFQFNGGGSREEVRDFALMARNEIVRVLADVGLELGAA